MVKRRAAPRIIFAIAFTCVVAVALPADAYAPVLHEFIPPDDGEDVALALTTAEGDLPAAIETRSGVVRAPDTQRQPTATESAYRESSAVPAVFRPDRDTRRPSVVRYDDPFSPSIAPYKRLRAFDLVGADYSLRVRDTSLVRVPVGGEARVGEEEFYADLTVDFESATTVLIPSVGPGARIIRQHTTPQVPLEVLRDGAENWYARATTSTRGRVHVVMQVAIQQSAFGGDFVMPAWAALAPVPPLPPVPARAFAKVQARLGLSRSDSPTETVKKLVAYFRAFTPSDELPRGQDDVYLDLVLSQKGVCRHRAFAFLVTALGLGIPARLVVNEAHAWVEVQGERLWQRIDLGGAAGAIEEHVSEARPSYRPPADAFDWPASAETGSGQAAAARGRQTAPTSPGVERTQRDATSSPAEGTEGASFSADPSSTTPSTSRGARERGADDLRSAPPDERPRPDVRVNGGDVRVRRGEPVRVAGSVEVDGVGCGQLRVDVSLKRAGTNDKTSIGSLTTDTKGAFDGSIYLPLAFPVGEYEVNAATPGDARCGSGSSR
jgi:transglutaminase-like putative cysteine protease